MNPLPVLLGGGCALLLALAGCGEDQAPVAAVPGHSPEQAAPAPATASSVLGRLAAVTPAERRLAYVNPAALEDLDTPLTTAQLTRAVLGPAGATRLASYAGEATAAVQAGDSATIVVAGAGHTVLGIGGQDRAHLEGTEPGKSLITDETPAAIQACLGDPAASVVVGPGVLGEMSAIGAGILESDDPPAGIKLRLCAAPHLARDLAVIEARFTRAFPAASAPSPDLAPVIGGQEIGEREIVGATIALGQLSGTELADLLGGGSGLVAFARSPG